MLEEFEKSVKATLYDRLTSPLVGSIVTAWSICNYKFFLIILSNLSFAEKSIALDDYFVRQNDIIRFTNYLFYLCNWEGIKVSWVYYYFNILIIPLFWSIIYICVYPRIATKVFAIWQQYVKNKREIKNELEEQTLLTQEESSRIRENFLRRKIELNSLLTERDKEIQILKEEIDRLQKSINISSKNVVNHEVVPSKDFTSEKNQNLEIKTQNLSRKAKLVFKKIAQSNEDSLQFASIGNNSFVLLGIKNNIRLKQNGKIIIDQLVENKLLEKLSNERYRITKLGYEFAKTI